MAAINSAISYAIWSSGQKLSYACIKFNPILLSAIWKSTFQNLFANVIHISYVYVAANKKWKL